MRTAQPFSSVSLSSCPLPAHTTMIATDPKQPPVWDLATHFGWSSWQDTELVTAIQDLEKLSKAFQESYCGNLKVKLEESIKKYEEITTLKVKAQSFLNLHFDTDQTNTELLKFKTMTDAKISQWV